MFWLSLGGHCGNINGIATFPNIDYSFYRYNILKGFPLSDGVDPGFTRAIFAGDFSDEHTTVDCR